MPSPATRPLFERAQVARHRLLSRLCRTGAGERRDAPLQHRDPGRQERGDRRQIPQGASARPRRRPSRTIRFSTWRSAISSPGDLGFPVWRAFGGNVGMCICNDRRWPETYRVMGLQSVELVLLGYNTPTASAVGAGLRSPGLTSTTTSCMQAGAYQNSTWVVGIAKAGNEEGANFSPAAASWRPRARSSRRRRPRADEVFTGKMRPRHQPVQQRRRCSTSPSTAASSTTG